VNLDIEFAFLEVFDLFRRQNERPGDVAARRGRNGKIANRRPSDSGSYTLMNMRQRRRALHPIERSGDGELGARKYGRDRARSRNFGAFGCLDPHGRQPRLEPLPGVLSQDHHTETNPCRYRSH